MTLTPGTSVGPYKILAALGAGGMGEVYRALDSTLGREVALKVLPEVFAHDPDRRARFEREARVLASLNHPNIATLYGLKQIGDRSVLEMELVPGQTLAERLLAGPLALGTALPIFRQIALALEAAHERGIVHRDLKPANVKITPDAWVKVLDFGLAKAFQADSGVEGSQSPTLTSGHTRDGQVLGTAAYMSPEQVRGRPLDRRTDIWSFGCMLFEALAGRPPFAADTVSDTLAAVLTAEPDWSALAAAPLPVRRLVQQCLRKDPQARLRDVGDARLSIEDAAGESAEMGSRAIARAIRSGPAWRRAVVLAGMAVVAVAAGAMTAWSLIGLREPAARPVARLVIALPPALQLERSASPSVAIAPDGSQLIYVAMSPGSRTQLYVRRLDRFEAVAVPGTEGASAPFFSPDGRWVGYYAQGALWKIAIEGGVPLKVCDAPSVWSATWEGSDTILFATMLASSGLWRVPAAGGAPEPLTTPEAERGELHHAFPEMLPDGRHVLFGILTDDGWRLGVLAVDTREVRRVDQPAAVGAGAQFVSSGHVVFPQAGTLVVTPFDAARLALSGFPVPMRERIDAMYAGSAQFTVSKSGVLAYVPGGSTPPARTLMLVERDGRATALSDMAAAFASPRFAPDGTRVAVTIASEAGDDIWIYDLARSARTRLTAGGANGLPVWAPDGRQVAFRSARAEPGQLFVRSGDGTGDPRPLINISASDRAAGSLLGLGVLPGSRPILTGANPQFPTSWARGGQTVAFEERKPGGERDIWVADGSEVIPFLLTSFDEHAATFSPDGRWLAYVSDESGRRDVYVQPYPGPGGRWLVSTRGGQDPVWSADGRELFYREGDRMMVVEVPRQPTFTIGLPRVLFEGRYAAADMGRNYDVSPDGRRFVMIRSDEPEPPVHLHIVLNWLDDLRARTSY